MSPPPSRELEIFTAALPLPAASRDAFLTHACGADATLRQRVEALLEAHGQAGDFLEESAEIPDAAPSPAITGEKPGDWIGRYKLLQQIGEGGCGVVYMAEQEEPVRRRVALKIIKPGMDTRSVIARFEAERQALALMDHPNIAKVFDAGATASGRPYFVMELVRGIKITTYCDEHALPTEDRLKLFIQVCQAVQHAHQKGVIHRDLKPSNILVTTNESGAPSPVVIDFGIAKATTNQRLTDKTLFTAFEMLIGTPAYMSPEQAAITGVDVDTRTDIYSLGVLLYELLTGSTPFDGGQLLKAGLDEIRRVIRDEEPVRPSARLNLLTRSDLTILADKRHAQPATLIRAVQGDLDWIAMKSLEKDRTRRYDSVNDLARDIQHYLAHEVVSARPPSTVYRLRKLIARHRVAFFGAVSILVLLLASLVVVSTLLARERQARREADADKSRAQVESAKSQQVTQFLEETLRGVSPSVALGRDTKMLREILDRAATRVRRDLTGQPASRAQLQIVIGQVYQQLGAFSQAEACFRDALALGRDSAFDDGRQLATALAELSVALTSQRKTEEALAMARESLALRRKLFGAESAEAAMSLLRLAGAHFGAGNYHEAERVAQECLVIRQHLFGRESLEVADTLRALHGSQRQVEKYAEALAASRESLAIRRKLLDPDDPTIAQSLQSLASLLGLLQQGEESEKTYTAAAAAWQKLGGENHVEVSRVRLGRAFMLMNTGRPAEAEPAFRALVADQRGVVAPAQSFLIESLVGLGETLRQRQRLPEAETSLRESLQLARRSLPVGHSYVATIYDRLAAILVDQGRIAETEKTLSDLLTPAFTALPESSFLLSVRAAFYAQRGRWAESAVDATKALHYSPTDSRLFELLALCLVQAKNRDGYREHCRKAAAFLGTADASTARRIVQACVLLPPAETGFPLLEPFAAIAAASLPLPKMVFAQCEEGLIEYRRGNYAATLDWADRALGDEPSDLVRGVAWPLQAMAYFRLGKIDHAREALGRLETTQKPGVARAAVPDDWRVRIIGDILQQEAAALLAGAPGAD